MRVLSSFFFFNESEFQQEKCVALALVRGLLPQPAGVWPERLQEGPHLRAQRAKGLTMSTLDAPAPVAAASAPPTPLAEAPETVHGDSLFPSGI